MSSPDRRWPRVSTQCRARVSTPCPPLVWTACRARLPGPDRGSGTVLALGLCAALLVVLVGCLSVLSAVQASTRARSAADSAALAGAQALASLSSPVDPCSAARQFARRNGARAVVCVIEGEAVVVRVRVRPSIAWLGEAAAVARAGPAASSDPMAESPDAKWHHRKIGALNVGFAARKADT